MGPGERGILLGGPERGLLGGSELRGVGLETPLAVNHGG